MNLAAKAQKLLASGEAAMIVRVVEVKGSAPREHGAKMLVTARGTYGSIGGGALEWQAAADAQRLLPSAIKACESDEVPWRQAQAKSFTLGPDLGQCCGGQVQLSFLPLTAETIRTLSDEPRRRIYLFGAGHVGRALVLVLAQSDLDIVWVDGRPDAFPPVVPGNVTLQPTDKPAPIFRTAPQGSFVFVMTHSHALDLAIVDAALRHPNILETALIGSATKRARFENRLTAAGVPKDKIKSMICPIGHAGIRSKKPEAIAISTAAQILALDEKHAMSAGLTMAEAS